jgi:hypothetical protein
MAFFLLEVPGHAVVPTQGGPDPFNNVILSGVEFRWTDQQGLRTPTETLFNGDAGRTENFHFPFTTPVIFGTTTAQAAFLRLSAVGVFFRMLPGDGAAVRLDRIRVFSGPSLIVDTLGIGLLGLNSPTLFFNSLVSGRNFFTFAFPLNFSERLGVTVTVNFGTGGVIRFGGARLRLQN